MIFKDLDECEYRCYLDANCVSLNIKNKDPNGTHECELNNSTHLEPDGDLMDDHLYYYRGAEVSNYEIFNFAPSLTLLDCILAPEALTHSSRVKPETRSGASEENASHFCREERLRGWGGGGEGEGEGLLFKRRK